MTLEFLSALSPIIDQYDAFIIDQWGVLHNGTEPYPGVHDVLSELKRQNKKIVLLTNSGRRTSHNRNRLDEMGFDTGLIDAIVTSGEAGWYALKHRDEVPYSELGSRCFLITRYGDMGVVDGLDLTICDDVAEADFVFLAGVDGPPKTMAEYFMIMDRAFERGLPVICANPDRVAVSNNGLVNAPGSVADYYEKLGGTVHYVGKPNRPIYAASLASLEGIDRARIVGIGDSLEHDIKGANNAGIDSIFIANGIHREALDDASNRDTALQQLYKKYDAWPTYVLPELAL